MPIRLYEKAFSKLTLDDYQAVLVSKGYTLIGQGIAGAVYQHPTLPNVVVKVQAGRVDDADMKWLRWCSKHRNPWSVKVYAIKSLPTVESAFAIYMEKLTPATRNQVTNELTAGGAVGRSMTSVLYPKGTHWRFVPEFDGDLSALPDPDLAEVLGVIYRLTRRVSGKLEGATDLKTDNFLMRGTQLVFVDPIA